MKKFIIRIVVGCMFSILSLVALCSFVLWCYDDDIAETFKLQANETTLFTGHSLTGCSVEEKPDDDYRVLWRSGTSQYFTLIRLKELERLGYIQQLKRVITCVGYKLVDESTDEYIARSIKSLLPMIWRHWDCLPMSSMISLECLNPRNYDKCPFDAPPVKGNSIVSRSNEYAQLFPDILKQSILERDIKECYNRHVFVFTEISKLCHKYGIEFVVVFSPHLSWCRENYWAVERFRMYEELFRKLNIRYIDCNDWIPDTYFRDNWHLLPEGARVFTPMLLRALNQTSGSDGMSE